ncbi:MAG: hypothetical protein U0232_11160 [Thermomicrobiales bacterium]
MMFYHYSDDPGIEVFHPRPIPPQSPGAPPASADYAGANLVWAIDEDHAPLYWFPRDCPRVAYWPLPTSTDEDIARFLGHTTARWVIAIEGGWWERVRSAKLYEYRLPGDTFRPQWSGGGPGYHVSREAVTPLSVELVGDLLARQVAANIELRITPSLWPLHRALIPATLHFSMVRMRNAQPEAGT